MNQTVPIRAFTSGELAKIYRISVQTFRRWVRPLEPLTGERIGNYYYPKQVGIIVEHLNKRLTPNVKTAIALLEVRRKRLAPKTKPKKRKSGGR